MQLQVLYYEQAMNAQPAPAEPVDALAVSCAAFKVRRLARRITQIYDEALTGSGLTVGQFGIIGRLRRRRGVGIADLAHQLTLDASTLSRLIRPLAQQGLLDVRPDPDDGRAKLLWLTDAGAERVRAAQQQWEVAQASVSARLGEARLAALRFTLDDAYDHLG